MTSATGRQAFRDRFDVSRETMERLDTIVERLRFWQARINLVAPSTLDAVWTRHIEDSWQLVDLAAGARTWIDFGSGGGFPGLVVCAGLAETGGHVHLVESNRKKAAFLRECARAAGLPATVHALRIEEFTAAYAGGCDIVSARALAPMTKLVEYVAPYLERGAQALLPKGQDVEQELTEATISWHIDYELVPSSTESGAKIVRLRGAARR